MALAAPILGDPGVSRARAWDEGPMCAVSSEALGDRLGDRADDLLLCAEPPLPGLDELTLSPEEAPPRSLPPAAVRARIAEAEALAEAGEADRAALVMREARLAMPEVRDRFLLREAELRMEGHPEASTCRLFAEAAESPVYEVAARARIGRVRCLLVLGSPEGPAALEELKTRYPALPHAQSLDLLHGALLERQAREREAEPREAVALYQSIDLLHPGSPAAAEARARLEALAEAGARVPRRSLTERVDRAGRLVRSGPMELAREEVEALRGMELPRTLAAQVAAHAARIARVEGRFDAAQALSREARGLPAADPEVTAQRIQQQRIQREREAAEASRAHRVEEAQARIRSLSSGQPLRRLPTVRMMQVLRLAAQAELRETVEEALAEASRRRLPPAVRFEVGVLAFGVGSDAEVASLFSRLTSDRQLGVHARYYHARALERLGRAGQARSEYEAVIRDDHGRPAFYALWARQRIHRIEEAERVALAMQRCASEGPWSPDPDVCSSSGSGKRTVSSDSGATVGPARPAQAAEAAAPAGEAPEAAGEAAEDPIPAALEQLAARHRLTFPWFGRALALYRIGDRAGAAEELHASYVAWAHARGRSVRTGRETIFRGEGSPVPPMAASAALLRERQRFPQSDRALLADTCAALGEYGLAIRFGGSRRAPAFPRAYEEEVRAAASRHRVDPNLLLAVMRTESVYNPRAISYVGAIGLMQIMPRTGRLIAERLGREGFTDDDLLDPATNIDFAAWYLASLIERFDGHVPLAVASYNGGPHNVRQWLEASAPHMPMEAFLEQIPFTQTHRYVRRVLTRYAAYRAQEGLPMIELGVDLPGHRVDRTAF